MSALYKRWEKKYNEIQLTKKMDLNNRKMKNNSPSPAKKNILQIINGFRGINWIT